jgi:hypothetical protein
LAKDFCLVRFKILADEDQHGLFFLKGLEFPAAGHEIKKMGALGETDKTLGAVNPTAQMVGEFFKTASLRRALVV